jgi:hypothetical protein
VMRLGYPTRKKSQTFMNPPWLISPASGRGFE